MCRLGTWVGNGDKGLGMVIAQVDIEDNAKFSRGDRIEQNIYGVRQKKGKSKEMVRESRVKVENAAVKAKEE